MFFTSVSESKLSSNRVIQSSKTHHRISIPLGGYHSMDIETLASIISETLCPLCCTNINAYCGAVAERLRHHSREQKVPRSIPRLDVSVEVTSLNANFDRLICVCWCVRPRNFKVPWCATRLIICRIVLVS